MKHFRSLLLVGALAILGVMAYLNIHVHLSFAQHDDHTPSASSSPGSPEPALRGLEVPPAPQPAASHVADYKRPAGMPVPRLPVVAKPVYTQPAAAPAPAQGTTAQRPPPPASASGGAMSVADLPDHLFDTPAAAPAPAPAPAPAQPTPPAAAPSPAAPGPQRVPVRSVGSGVPMTMAELAAAKEPLNRQQRRALYDHCKDEQDNVLFFTYANINGSDDKYCRFLESTAQNRIPMTVLNWGGEHKGNGNKLVFTRKAIETLNPCDVIIFSDAFDVLYAEGPEEIRKKYMSINAPVIVSAECGCWPFIVHKNGRDICLNQFPKSPTDYRYINSGMWGARAYAAEDLIRRIMERNSLATVQKMSDQEQISTLLLTGEYDWEKDIQIDYYASMFLNMHMADDYGRCDPEKDVMFSEGRLLNKRTNYVPSMYHFNGGSKKRMGDAEESMWYKQQKPIRPALNFQEVMDTKIRIADKAMNFKTVKVKDMCPSFKGKSLLRPGQPNYFKRGQ